MQPSGAPNTVYAIIPVTTNQLEFYIEALPYPTRSLNNNPLAGQISTLGKRLSARTYIGYEQGLTAAAGAVKLTHALTPHISVVTRSWEDNAIDVFYHFDFD